MALSTQCRLASEGSRRENKAVFRKALDMYNSAQQTTTKSPRPLLVQTSSCQTMSSIPSRSGPSRHYDIDHSSHETSIGRYTNNAIHVSDPRTLHLQVIQNHASANDWDNLSEPLRMFLALLSVVLSENH